MVVSKISSSTYLDAISTGAAAEILIENLLAYFPRRYFRASWQLAIWNDKITAHGDLL